MEIKGLFRDSGAILCKSTRVWHSFMDDGVSSSRMSMKIVGSRGGIFELIFVNVSRIRSILATISSLKCRCRAKFFGKLHKCGQLGIQ